MAPQRRLMCVPSSATQRRSARVRCGRRWREARVDTPPSPSKGSPDILSLARAHVSSSCSGSVPCKQKTNTPEDKSLNDGTEITSHTHQPTPAAHAQRLLDLVVTSSVSPGPSGAEKLSPCTASHPFVFVCFIYFSPFLLLFLTAAVFVSSPRRRLQDKVTCL